MALAVLLAMLVLSGRAHAGYTAAVKNPTARLLCYQAKPAKGEPKHTSAKGVFVTVKEEEFCVPSTTTVE